MIIEITKKSVKKAMPKLYSITLNLVCTDGLIEVINQDFLQKYRTGQDINDIVSKFKTEMQGAIDTYKEETQIYSATQFDTAIVTLKNSLIG